MTHSLIKGALSKRAGAVALASVLALGAPAPGQAQESWRMDIHTAVPNSSLYFRLTEEFAESLERMSGGRIQTHVLPDGAEIGAFELLEAVDGGVITAGYAWPHYWSGLHPAYVLFSNVPASVGMDQSVLMSWYYSGGGRELYRELMQDVMNLDVEAFLMQPMGPEPLGWFSREFENMDALRSLRFRVPPGISGETYNAMGVPAVALPGSELVPAAQRGTLDAAEWIGPADDRNLGLHRVWNYYYLQGLHQHTSVAELLVSKTWWDSLPDDLQAIVEAAVMQNVTLTMAVHMHENARAIAEYEAEGVNVLDTPEDYFTTFIEAQNGVIQNYLDTDEFFARVHESQVEFADLLRPYHSRALGTYTRVTDR
jgi:TRAP-type mannitol/chloroaromatic compound transport system substrate-binding protein